MTNTAGEFNLCAKPKSFLTEWGNGGAWLAVIIGLWLWVWWHLAVEWRTNVKYQYGYLVPFLSLYLAWLRIDRPGAMGSAVTAGPGRQAGSSACVYAGWALWVVAALMYQVDPAWRLVAYFMMGGTTVLTIGWLRRVGGDDLVRCMRFPLAFTWTAVAWPMTLDQPLTQGLMQGVTAISVSILNACQVAALQRGSVIELARATVGVDEACSGIQSLQGSLMVSLFLGELYRMKAGGRFMLVIVAGGVALAGNLVRTVALAWLSNLHGAAAVSHYHDVAGYLLTAAIFGGIWLVAIRFDRGRTTVRTWPSHSVAWPSVWVAGCDGYRLLLAVLLIPVLTWGWFAARGVRMSQQKAPRWSIQIDRLPAAWKHERLEISPGMLRELWCTEWQAFRINPPDGSPIRAYHFFWRPGIDIPSIGVWHTPDVCMPGSGWHEKGQGVPVEVRIGQQEFPAVVFRFTLDNVEISVLHAIWHGGQPKMFAWLPATLLDKWDRFSLLWEGRQNRGHEVLTVVVNSPRNAAEEMRLFENFLNRVLVTTSTGAGE